MSLAKTLKRYVPILEWLPNYSRKDFFNDVPAGITVGILLIPQGIAYALIANLPPIYGLYAALAPQIVYALLGTSRQMSIGPAAMDSLIVAAGISAIASVSEDEYIAMAIALSFLMGLIQFSLGLLRLGFVVQFMSKPVISGFTSAAAIIIALNQLNNFLGIDFEQSNQIHWLLSNMLVEFKNINLPSLALGAITILITIGLKKINKKIPSSILVVVLGILVVKYFKLTNYGIEIVGSIPKGLPHFSIPTINYTFINELVTLAATLAVIAFMEAISIAKKLEERHSEYKVDANQELKALGISNLVGSFFLCYPTNGSFSRSAVNDESGASTNISSLISAGVIILTLLYFTPVFYYLPKSVLAAIIIVSVFGLIEVKYPKSLWSYKKDDLLMLLITFIITISIGIKEGILTGVVFSLILLIYRSTKPHIAQCEKIEGTNYYRNIDRFKNVKKNPKVLIVRLDGQLYFANVEYFKAELLKMISLKGDELKMVVWNAEGVSNLDSTAIVMLEALIAELKHKNILFAVAGATGPVRDLLFKSKLSKTITKELMFNEVEKAVESLNLGFDQKEHKKNNKIAHQRN